MLDPPLTWYVKVITTLIEANGIIVGLDVLVMNSNAPHGKHQPSQWVRWGECTISDTVRSRGRQFPSSQRCLRGSSRFLCLHFESHLLSHDSQTACNSGIPTRRTRGNNLSKFQTSIMNYIRKFKLLRSNPCGSDAASDFILQRRCFNLLTNCVISFRRCSRTLGYGMDSMIQYINQSISGSLAL